LFAVLLDHSWRWRPNTHGNLKYSHTTWKPEWQQPGVSQPFLHICYWRKLKQPHLHRHCVSK